MEHIDIDNDNYSTDHNKYSGYSTYIDSIVSMYNKIHHILLISLNDILLKDNLNNLKDDPLVNDTIKIMKKFNYNFEDIYYKGNSSWDSEENSFVKLSDNLKEILSSNFIENFKIQKEAAPVTVTKNKKTNSKIKTNLKKSYEVDVLSSYLEVILKEEQVNCVLEMGCGKSYLTEHILLNDEMIYIGIDKKDELIEKNTKNISADNSFVLNHNVTVANFQDLFKNEISPILTKASKSTDNILLFGLHSCGNLTSDTIKVFAQNECFSQIVIIGCCLNLLVEYVTKEAKESELFDYYFKNIGYDSKGNFLEQTLIYDYDFNKLGYPLSSYVITKYPSLFLGRTVRNSSMQNFPQNQDKVINSSSNVFYKKILYRTILQAFFEFYLPELKNYYGYGKVNLKIEDDFFTYLHQIFKNLQNKEKEKYFDKIEELNLKLSKENIDEDFLSKMLQYEDILWAVYIIRLKFSKIVEYLIAVDRILYMKEKGIRDIKLIKIFDESLSVRNLLIHATKK